MGRLGHTSISHSSFIHANAHSHDGQHAAQLSEVEQIAERLESLRNNRVAVTVRARIRFLQDCRSIATDAGRTKARITLTELQKYRQGIENEMAQQPSYRYMIRKVLRSVGILVDLDCLLALVDRALEETTHHAPTHALESKQHHVWFYYKEFNFDHVHTVSRYPFLQNELCVAFMVVFLYYLFTPILFCNMMAESNICGGLDGDTYRGWVSALYFASTTLSTVGYGDLSVAQDPAWKSFIGSMYMLLSMVVAVVALSSVASATFSPLENVFHRLFEKMTGRSPEEQFLHERIRRVRLTKITELTASIAVFIAVGVFAARIAAHFEDDPERQWSWMTSFYWAVQTTTTIGYGGAFSAKTNVWKK